MKTAEDALAIIEIQILHANKLAAVRQIQADSVRDVAQRIRRTGDDLLADSIFALANDIEQGKANL
jgi:hypothetical protein